MGGGRKGWGHLNSDNREQSPKWPAVELSLIDGGALPALTGFEPATASLLHTAVIGWLDQTDVYI